MLMFLCTLRIVTACVTNFPHPNPLNTQKAVKNSESEGPFTDANSSWLVQNETFVIIKLASNYNA